MPLSFHDSVVRIVRDLFDEYRLNGKKHYREIYFHGGTGSQRVSIPIPQTTGRGSFNMDYQPDVWGKGGIHDYIDMVEVWDSETQDGAIADVIFASLVPHGNFLGIVCTGANYKKKEALKLVDFLRRKLSDASSANRILKVQQKLLVCEIPSQMRDSEDEIKSLIATEFGFV